MPESPQRVLVIAAHPDDEILGVGGTVLKHTGRGDEVVTIVACEGESLRYEGSEPGMKSQSQRAAEILGVQRLECLDFPDQGLDRFTLTEIITPIEKVVRELRPDTVYCQYGGDVNRDHELLFKAVLVATRPTEAFISEVYAFDTASSTEWAYPRSFVPDTWIEISSVLERKIEAMACYETEMRDYPHPRSAESLRNKARAWGNQCCMDAAEVFMTVRRVQRES